MNLSVEKFAFFSCTVLFPSRIQDVVIDCCTSEENWKQVIRFFTENSTVARLEEQTEHYYMPAL